MEGKLVIEVYEYMKDSYSMPAFEYIPCELSKCLKGKSSTLKEIIQRGFDALPKKAQDSEKRREVLQKLEDANIGRIDVAFHQAKGSDDAYIELTNVVPVTISYADARRTKVNKDDIILRGRYKLSDGNETTMLRDAQRLTLIYSTYSENTKSVFAGPDEDEEPEEEREICLNVTYLQE